MEASSLIVSTRHSHSPKRNGHRLGRRHRFASFSYCPKSVLPFPLYCYRYFPRPHLLLVAVCAALTALIWLLLASEALVTFPGTAAAADAYPPLTMDVRFNRQQTLLEGVIEVQPTVADPWGSICSYMFKSDPDQANVVCSQMGFGLSPLTSFLPLGSVADASSRVWFDEVNCTRALADKVAQYPNGIVPPTVRMNISSCSYVMTPRNDTSPCLHRRDVGVRCVPPASAWEFKLVNTSVLPTRGLVLMRPTKHLGTDVLPWGTVHNTYFRNNRFAVLALCRSMGFVDTTAPSVQINGESGYATTAPAGTRNGAPAYLTVTSCPSDATHLQNCTGYNFEGLTWSNSYQLAVQCDDETDSGRIYGYNIMAQVKLINGFSSSHGQIYVRDSAGASYDWDATTGWRYIPAALLLYGPPYDSAVTAAQNKASLLMICRAAGFTTATNPAFRFVGALPAITGTSAVDYQRIECITNPTNVTADCKFYKTTANFSGNAAYPSGVDCFPDDTASRPFEYRLINGTTGSNGIVQMRLGPDTAWGTISNPRANDYSLWETVCGALGYKGGINSTFAYRYLYQFTNNVLYQSESNGNLYAPIYLDDVQCPQLPPYMYNASARPRPNLNSIKDNCTYSPLGSSLYPTHRTLALDCDTASAGSSSYRTNVSDSRKLGILSHNYGDFVPWLSINTGLKYYNLCGSDPNAYVAICRMLGFTFTNLSTLAIRSYTPPSVAQTPTSNGDPLSLGNLSCTYNASTWADCSHDHLLVESCPNGYPTINCYAIPDMSQAEFRLVGGAVASSGRVEMRPTPLHEWGTIRNNGWTTTDRRMPILLCRFLGYTDDTRPRSRAVTAYGQGVGVVYFSYAYCDNGIFPDCLLRYFGSASQSHSGDLGVDCEGPVVPDISQFQFRGIVAELTATDTYYRVEMREGPDYEWGRMYQRSSTPYLIYLACKAIGQFDFANNQTDLISGYRNASLPLKVSNFACSASSATALNECTFDANSYLNSDNEGPSFDFVVNCNRRPASTGFQLRLANGTTPMNGRLEHRENPASVWQSVSESIPSGYNYYWGYFYNVFAACRTFGFPYNFNLSLYGYAHTPVRLVPYNYFGHSKVAAEQTGMGITCAAAFGANLPSCTYYMSASNFDENKVIALDCNSTLYSLDNSEYRINKNVSFSTYYRFEMRPNASVPWGTIASRNSTLDQAFMVKMCEAAGEPMPKKWVATYDYSSDVYDYTDLPIYAYRWNCPDGYTHIKQCSTGIEPHDNFAADTALWRRPHNYDTYINCAAYPPGNGSEWTLRLVTGNDTVATNGEGILQIIPWTSISEFGTLCNNSWSLDTTRAACRSVGWGVETLFNATTVAAIQSSVSPSLFGGGNVAAYKNITVWYSGVYVTANNYLVQDRAANDVGPVTTSSCLTHANDVALKCSTQLFNVADFEFRGVIVYPGIPSIVRLEMRPNPSQPWGTAYETNRTNANVAKAVCRMLGYTGEYATHHTSIVAGSGTVWLPPLTCEGQVTHPAQCTFNKTFFQYYTTHSYDVTVNCLTVPLTYPVDVSSFAFRLTNTGNKAQGTVGFGRLEVRPTPYAEWGSIDASGMTNELATAACRSAGLISPDPIDAQFTTNLSPPMVGYQWMQLSGCPDAPDSLSDCSSINWLARTTGSHSNDVWLECYPKVNFRLYGGPTNASGLVQVRLGNYSGDWGVLCSDAFERSHDAWRVVCLSMGFPSNVRAHFTQDYVPSGSTDRVLLDDLWCPPGAETLSQCIYRQPGTSDCNYRYDAASLECTAPSDWQFRIAGTGATSTRGRLEIHPNLLDPNATWSMICQNKFNHTLAAWMAACRSVGLHNTTRAQSVNNFGPGYGPIVLDGVDCSSSSTTLADCATFPLGSYDCLPSATAGIDCDPPAEDVLQWEFRLNPSTIVRRTNRADEDGDGRFDDGGISPFAVINGTTVTTAGTLEVRFSASSQWGTVCANNPLFLHQLKQNAELICRSLGIPQNYSVLGPRVYRTNKTVIAAPEWQPILLSNISCPDPERISHIRFCEHNEMHDHSCDHSQDIHVDCRPQTPHQPSFEVTVTAGDLPTPPDLRTPSRTLSATAELPRMLDPIPAVVQMADTTAAVASGIVSSVALVGGVTGAGQLGVANAMTRLASCDDEDEDPDEGLPILVHPLQFTLFEGSGTLRGAYAASLIGNCLIIPAVIALFVHGPLQLIIRFVKGGGMGRDEAVAEIGWPSVLIMPFSTLAEGIGVGLVRSFRRDDDDSASQQTISVGVGCIGALVLATFVASWVFMLAKKMPRRKVTFRREAAPTADVGEGRDGDGGEEDVELTDLALPLVPPDGDGPYPGHGFALPLHDQKPTAHKRSGGVRALLASLTLRYLMNPTHRWEPLTAQELRSVSGGGGDKAASPSSLRPIPEADMERYGSAVGDSRLYYAELTSCVCSLIVGFAEGVPATHCRPRAVVALMAAVVQCGCSVMTVVPVELALQALLAVCIVPVSFAVTAKVFMDGGDDADGDGVGDLLSFADSAIAVLSVVGNFFGILLMVVGLGRGLWGVVASYRMNRPQLLALSDGAHHRADVLVAPTRADGDEDDLDVPPADDHTSAVPEVDDLDLAHGSREAPPVAPPGHAVVDDLDPAVDSPRCVPTQTRRAPRSLAVPLPPPPPLPIMSQVWSGATRLGSRYGASSAFGGIGATAKQQQMPLLSQQEEAMLDMVEREAERRSRAVGGSSRGRY